MQTHNKSSYFLNLLILVLALLLFKVNTQTPRIIPVHNPNEILFTFGSCNAFYGDEPNDIFLRVAELNPDVWAWLGDVAYIDRKGFARFGFLGEEVTHERFTNARNNPVYSVLRESTPVIGVWDDHDYGLNNGGKNNKHRDIMQQLWLDFVDEPKDSIRRQRPGIYESYYLGDPTKVKVILLDIRYFKDHPGLFSTGKDMLGDSQWVWFENELKENQAEYIVIGSGVQIIPDDRLLPETWYKQSLDKLFGLIRKYKTGGVILISGDVHYTEIMKHPCKERIGFELYEFTSSGTTHFSASHVPLVDGIQAHIYPDTYNAIEDKCFERNFGAIRFNFGENKGAKLEARNYYGTLVLEKDIPYSELQFNESMLNDTAYCVVDTSRHWRFWKHFVSSLLKGEKYVYLVALIYAVFFTILGLGITGVYVVLKKIVNLLRKKDSKNLKTKPE